MAVDRLFPALMCRATVTRVALLCAAFALNACTTLGPDYQEPEVSWLDDWHTSLYGQISAPEQQSRVDLHFWWRLFDDVALNRLIELARQENPSLRIAGLRIMESRAQLGIAGSNLYPQLQQLGGAIDYVNTHRRGGSLPDDDQSLVNYQAGFNLGWELDFWGRFRRGIESADAAYLLSRLDTPASSISRPARSSGMPSAMSTESSTPAAAWPSPSPVSGSSSSTTRETL